MCAERREPQLLILSCCLTYPLQRTGRIFRLGVRDAFAVAGSLGQTSSLHPLRRRLPTLFEASSGTQSVRLSQGSVRHRRRP